MNRLLGRLTGQEIDSENDTENDQEIPDVVPPEWSELTPDPAPGTRKAGAPLVPKTYGKVTPALKKRIAAEIEAYVEFAAMPVMMRDPTCGGALHEQAKPIADALATILGRYPDMAHKFLATGVLGDWLKLGIALQPVVGAVWSHHVVNQPAQGGVEDDLDLTGYDEFRPGA